MAMLNKAIGTTNQTMCRINLNIETTSTNISLVKGRYRLVGTSSWTNFNTDINNPQTPGIPNDGNYELEIRIFNGETWSDWFIVSTFQIGKCK